MWKGNTRTYFLNLWLFRHVYKSIWVHLFYHFISEIREQIFMNIWTGRKMAYNPKFFGVNVIWILSIPSQK
jgi:hypothetical protein